MEFDNLNAYPDSNNSNLNDLNRKSAQFTYVNKNNNKICAEDNLNLSHRVVENHNNIEKQESSCKIFFELINQIRHNRQIKLKPVSCQIANDSFLKSRLKNSSIESGFHHSIPLCDEFIRDICKKKVVLNSEKKKIVNLKSDETLNDVYSYTNNVSFIQEKQKGFLENGERSERNIKNSKPSSLLVMSKSDTNYESKILNRENGKMMKKISFKKLKSRSTQTKPCLYYSHIAKYYINNVCDLICARLEEESLALYSNLFCDHFIKSCDSIPNTLRRDLLKVGKDETINKTESASQTSDPLLTIDHGKNSSLDFAEKLKLVENIFVKPTNNLLAISKLDDIKNVKISSETDFSVREDPPNPTNSTNQIFPNPLVPDKKALQLQLLKLKPSHQDPKLKSTKVNVVDSHIMEDFDDIPLLGKIETDWYQTLTETGSVISHTIEKLVVTKFELVFHSDITTVHFDVKEITETSKMTVDYNEINFVSHTCVSSNRNSKDIFKSLRKLPQNYSFKVETRVLMNIEEHVKSFYEKDVIASVFYDLLNSEEFEKCRCESYQEYTLLSEKLSQWSLKSSELKSCTDILKIKCNQILNELSSLNSPNKQDKITINMYNSESYSNVCPDMLEDCRTTLNSERIKWNVNRQSEIFSKVDLIIECSLIHFDKSKKISFPNDRFPYQNPYVDGNVTGLSTQTDLVETRRSTYMAMYEHFDPDHSQMVADREPFPIRCGIRSLYRFIFQSWIFQ